MKKELEDLREIATSLVTAKLTFDQRKRFFEKNVEEKLSVDNDEVYMIPVTDHYTLAKDIISENTTLIITISNIRAKHPKYGNARLKEEVVKTMKEKFSLENNFVFETSISAIEQTVNTYFLYEECGVLDIIEAEESLNRQIKNTDQSLDLVIGDNTTVKTIKSTVMNIVSNDDNLKTQVSNIKENTKGFVNKKSKKLVKLFESVIEKTTPEE